MLSGMQVVDVILRSTDEIGLDDVLAEANAPLAFRVDFRVPSPSTGWLQHPDQLNWAALEARRAFERAMQLAPRAMPSPQLS